MSEKYIFREEMNIRVHLKVKASSEYSHAFSKKVVKAGISKQQ